MANDMISYTLSSGITVTASREYINQLRKEQAERARELAARGK